jgi:pimeloyl-ACP methyl ester carboxylesterase
MTPAPFEHRELVVEGHRLAYLEAGAGPPLLLLHGIPTSSLLWRDIIPALARSRRVIAPDLLNYGRSDKPERADVSINAQARLMSGLMDALGLRRADVAAHDIGGGVAQIMAVRRPERIARLVLANSVCFDSWPIPEFEPLQEPGAEDGTSLADFLTMMRGFLPNGVHRPEALGQDVIEMMLEPWSDEAGKRALFRNFRRLNPEYTQAIAGELETLPQPTLVLWGRHDPFQKLGYGERLAATIPEARLEVVEDTAHWIMEEKPEEVAARLQTFLDG